tara:strand:- start:860 stop:1390 length:531 start_codon:yes stop_codon:yes gene_type:complete
MEMVSIVKEISSKIRGVIRNLSKSKNELFINRIEEDVKLNVFKIKLGNSFNGHSMRLTTTSFGGSKIIGFYNQYYMGSVKCNYHTKEDKTIVDVFAINKTPKYISDKIHITEEDRYKKEVLNGKLKIIITKHTIETTLTSEHDGINFMNHFDNINQLKSLNEYTKEIKKTYKNGHR